MEKQNETTGAEATVYLILSLLLSLAVFIPVAFLFLKGSAVENTELIKIYSPLFLNGDFGLAPERRERIIYQLGIVFLPAASAFFYFVLQKLLRRVESWKKLTGKREFHILAAIVLLQIIFWWGALIYAGAVEDGPNGAGQFTQFHPVSFYAVAVIIIGFIGVYLKKILFYKNPLVFILGVLSVFLPAVFLFLPEGFFLSEFGLRHNFTPLLGAVSQAVHSRTALINFQSQYGILFPHLAEPFMRMAGLTVNNLNIYFLVLTAISWLFIYLAVAEMTGYGSVIGFFIILTVAGFSHPLFEEYNFNNPYLVPYFQYNPIRVLWGAVMLWFVARFLKKRTRVHYVLGFALSMMAFLYNLDTGVVIFLSFVALLCFERVNDIKSNFRLRLWGAKAPIFAGLISLLLMVILYSLFGFFRSGRIPDWSSLFTFQSIFYQSGFFMIGMKPIDLWHIPILIYLVTITSCLIKMIRGTGEFRDKYYFYLAVYGVGIFTFFQGRSNILNLFPPLYPAVLLALYYCYDFLKKYDLKIKNLKILFSRPSFFYEFILIMTLIIILSHGFINYFRYFSPGLNSAIANWRVEGKTLDVKIQRRIDFIKMKMKSQNIMIIADDEQYMYLKTGTYGNLPYSSLEEISLVRQAEEVLRSVKDGHFDQIFIDPSSKLGSYLIQKSSPELEKTFLLLP